MPRMAPPPLGSEIVGAEKGFCPSAVASGFPCWTIRLSPNRHACQLCVTFTRQCPIVQHLDGAGTRNQRHRTSSTYLPGLVHGSPHAKANQSSSIELLV